VLSHRPGNDRHWRWRRRCRGAFRCRCAHRREHADADDDDDQRDNGDHNLPAHVWFLPGQAVQQEVVVVPVVEAIPVVVDTPVVVDIPVVGQGSAVPTVESEGAAGSGRVSGGLRPPAPSSVEPIGIPTRPPADTAPIMVGDEADAAGAPKDAPAVVAQVPDAVPAVPPPSNSIVETAVGADVPALDIPVPTDVPVIELPRPDDVPAIELPVPETVGGLPNDVCGIEPPMPEHCVTVPIVDVPSIGLTPGVLSSVAPMGMPVGATCEPGPMPSGEVGLRLGTGLPIPPTCANTGPQPNSAASVAAINARRIMISIVPDE
jgi:hypothetical protein